MTSVEAILARACVIPVLTLDSAATAVPLARALVAGGLPVLEVTLRTPAALAALAAIAEAVPEAIVGAGTVTTPAELRDAARAGARFAISPGYLPALADAATACGVPLLPGVATPSEVMRVRADGFRLAKLFPAAPAGGIPLLKALAGPFPDQRFCPTGGIGANTAADYLALPNVAAIGGSWVAPAAAVTAGDWTEVRRLASAAAALRPPTPSAR